MRRKPIVPGPDHDLIATRIISLGARRADQVVDETGLHRGLDQRVTARRRAAALAGT